MRKYYRYNYSKLPKDVGVVKYEDIPSCKKLRVFDQEIPLLCSGKIMYEGEPILLLYGADERCLEQIASEIRIEYETDYTIMPFENYQEYQINKRLTFNKGKSDSKIRDAFRVIEERFFTSFQNHFDVEPQGAIARKNDEGFEIICTSQWPFNVRNNVSACLGMNAKDISVRVPSMGKSHNGKLWYSGIQACYAAIVSKKTGRPSICLLPKQDAVLYTPRRAASIIKHITGLDEEGNILGRKIDILINAGAYPILSEEAINRICFSAAGVYMTQALSIEAKIIRTNFPPAGAFNGMGFHQSFFAGESHINSFAESSGMDPLDCA